MNHADCFGCLNHELLIAKLEAYGFDHASLIIILNYLSGRKHRTKVNNYYSGWSFITFGVPKGSILGLLIFNIYINDIFYFVDDANYVDDNTPHTTAKDIDTVLNYADDNTPHTTAKDIDTVLNYVDDNTPHTTAKDIDTVLNYADDNTPHTTAKDIDTVLNYVDDNTPHTTAKDIDTVLNYVDDNTPHTTAKDIDTVLNYVDDNTPHTTAKDIDTVLNYLANETYILIKWFDGNYFKLNGDKCKLLVSNNDATTSLVIGGHRVTGQRNVKFLGIKTDNKLDFNDHVSMIYKNASHKLHALARNSPFMNKYKLRVLIL